LILWSNSFILGSGVVSIARATDLGSLCNKWLNDESALNELRDAFNNNSIDVDVCFTSPIEHEIDRLLQLPDRSKGLELAQLVQAKRTDQTSVLRILFDLWKDKHDAEVFKDLSNWFKFNNNSVDVDVCFTPPIEREIDRLLQLPDRSKGLELAQLVQAKRSDQTSVLRILFDLWTRDKSVFSDLRDWFNNNLIDVDICVNPIKPEICRLLQLTYRSKGLKIAQLVQEKRSDKTAVLNFLFEQLKYDDLVYGDLKGWFQQNHGNIVWLDDASANLEMRGLLQNNIKKLDLEYYIRYFNLNVNEKKKIKKWVFNPLFGVFERGDEVFKALKKRVESDSTAIDKVTYDTTKFYGPQLNSLGEVELVGLSVKLPSPQEIDITIFFAGVGALHFQMRSSDTTWYKEALEELRKLGKSKLLAQVLIGLGVVGYDEQHGTEAAWYKDALKVLGEEGDRNVRARALLHLGEAGYTDKQHRTETVWYQDVLKVLVKQNPNVADRAQMNLVTLEDRKLRAKALMNLGRLGWIDPADNTKASSYIDALEELEYHVTGETRENREFAIKLLGKLEGKDRKSTIQADWYKKVFALKQGDRGLRALIMILLGYEGYTDSWHKTAADWFKEALAVLGNDIDSRLRAEALINLGELGHTDQIRETQVAWYKEALDVLNEDYKELTKDECFAIKCSALRLEQGDKYLRAWALVTVCEWGHMDYTTKVNWYKNACYMLKDQADQKDRDLRAAALINLGELGYTDEQHGTEAAWHKDALKVLGEQGNKELRAQALCSLGFDGWLKNDYKAGEDCYREALKVLGEQGDRNLRASALRGLGVLCIKHPTDGTKAAWFKEALAVLGEQGNKVERAEVLVNLAEVGYTDQAHSTRVDWYKEALRVLGGGHNYRNLQATALIGLGDAGYRDQAHSTGVDWYKEALEVLGERGFRRLRAKALIAIGDAAYADEGPGCPSEDWYREARDVLGAQGDMGLRIEASMKLYANQMHRIKQYYCERILFGFGLTFGLAALRVWAVVNPKIQTTS